MAKKRISVKTAPIPVPVEYGSQSRVLFTIPPISVSVVVTVDTQTGAATFTDARIQNPGNAMRRMREYAQEPLGQRRLPRDAPAGEIRTARWFLTLQKITLQVQALESIIYRPENCQGRGDGGGALCKWLRGVSAFGVISYTQRLDREQYKREDGRRWIRVGIEKGETIEKHYAGESRKPTPVRSLLTTKCLEIPIGEPVLEWIENGIIATLPIKPSASGGGTSKKKSKKKK